MESQAFLIASNYDACIRGSMRASPHLYLNASCDILRIFAKALMHNDYLYEGAIVWTIIYRKAMF